MTFSYTRDIPASGHNPSTDQPPMGINTNSIDDLIDVDHYSFNQANGGKHTQVQMPILSTIPSVAVAGEGTLYTKNVNSQAQLFYTPDATTNEYQITRVRSGQFTNFGLNNALTTSTGTGVGGWTFLPGNLMINYGTCTTTDSGTTVTFSAPFTSTVFSIQMTGLQNTTNRHFYYVRSVSTTGFVTTQLDSGGAGETSSFSFIAIGI